MPSTTLHPKRAALETVNRSAEACESFWPVQRVLQAIEPVLVGALVFEYAIEALGEAFADPTSRAK